MAVYPFSPLYWTRKLIVACLDVDTVYCLACSNNGDAIKRIYAIKNRPSEKPISLWIHTVDLLHKVTIRGVTHLFVVHKKIDLHILLASF
jgi:tRNA A37 threonylcarbamoyladenosine synthetase subunit TsaC/SUA5/YrdC